MEYTTLSSSIHRYLIALTALLAILAAVNSLFGSIINAALQAGASLAIIILAWDVFEKAFSDIRSRVLSAEILVLAVSLVSLIWSFYIVFSGLPQGAIASSALLFGAVGAPVALTRIIRSLEEVPSATQEEKALQARKVLDGKEQVLDSDKLADGDVIKVKPGETIPIDGILHVGSTRVDESSLTGQSSVKKRKGDALYAGTKNKTGMILLRVSSKDSISKKIAHVIDEALSMDTPLLRATRRTETVLVVIGLVGMFLAAGYWLFFPTANATMLTALVAMLAVGCAVSPLATRFSAPKIISKALKAIAAKGVLLRSGRVVEQLGSDSLIVVDHSAIMERAEVAFVKAYYDIGEESMLRYVASLESALDDTVSNAITSYADARNVRFGAPRAHEWVDGFGVKGKVEGRKVLAGSLAFFEKEGIGLYDLREQIPRLTKKGYLPICVAVEGKLAGLLGLRISLMQNIKPLFDSQTVLVSSAPPQVAQHHAKELGISVVRAELSRKKRLSLIRSYTKKRFVVVLSNHEELLGAGSLGVSRGVHATSEVVILQDSYAPLSHALQISRSAMRNHRQNSSLIIAYHVVMLPLAAGALFTVTGIALGPVLACILSAGVALIVHKRSSLVAQTL